MANNSSAPKSPAPGSEAERAKSRNVRALGALWPFMRPYTGWLYAALTALLVTAVISLVLPLAVRRVVDNFDTAALEVLDLYFLAAVGIASLLAIGTAVRYLLVTKLGEMVITDIRKAVFGRVLSLSPQFFDKVMTGEVLSRITTDTTLILTVIGSSVSWALRNILLSIGGIVMMALTSPKLTGLVLLLVPVLLVPILVLGRRLQRLSRENQDWIAATSANAGEALPAVQTVQAFTHEAQTRDAFGGVADRALDVARQRINLRAFLTAIIIFLVFTGIVGVLWIGARDVRAGDMSLGMLIQFVIYAVLVAGSLGALSEIWAEIQRAAGATERLVELLEVEDTVIDPAHPRPLARPVAGTILLEDLSFSYPARLETRVLSNVDLEIAAGETVALVGPSGSGKTTLLALMLRFYDPDAGRILIDGIDIADMARHDFRQALSLVPQEPVIFAASARDNIRFGRPDATDAEVEAAATAAAAHGFITQLADGYDTYLGERGVMLSGGQKQRVAIARAILRDAPILMLDEATSALDAESERAVQSAVDALSAGRTTIIVAHRLATVKKADRIIVLDGGTVVAIGTHDALVAQGGLYARLARLQFTDGAVAAE